MGILVDSHVHIFEDNLEKWLSKVSLGPLSEIVSTRRLGQIRKQARTWMKPFAGSLHSLHTTLRYFPETARKRLDELSAFVPLPSLLVEATAADLLESMNESGVSFALAIAHPPFLSNDLLLELSQENSRFIPAVSIPKKTAKPGAVLKNYISKGAKALSLHPAAEGEGPDSPRYRALIRTAALAGIPVIIHTGSIQARVFYKDPSYGRAERFTGWFDAYPETSFVLANMNFHEPHVAMDICEEFPNVFINTSWQPAEIIGEAVRRVGASKVLFSTDWPFLGDNIAVGLNRIRDCVEIGLLNDEQSKLILGENAVKLLRLSVDAYTTE